MLQVAHEQRRHRGGVDTARLRGGGAFGLRAGGRDVGLARRTARQRCQQLGANIAARFHQKAVSGRVDQLRERQVMPAAHGRPGVHSAAKAGVGRHGAVDRHQQDRLAPGGVGGIHVLAAGEHPVLHADGRQLAGAHADEGAPGRVDRLRQEVQPAVMRALHGKQGLPGREQIAFPRVRADGVAEHGVVIAPLQAIAARCLTVGPADRQLGHRVDALVDDGALAPHRAGGLVAASMQRVQQRLQPVEVDQLHRMHAS